MKIKAICRFPVAKSQKGTWS